jgi:hypothetical protein
MEQTFESQALWGRHTNRYLVGLCALVGSVTSPLIPEFMEHTPETGPLLPGTIQSIHLDIYPVTLQASEFGKAEYPEGMLAQNATTGWLRLGEVTDGKLPTTVEAIEHPVQTIASPDITGIPDFCDSKQVTDFSVALAKAVDYDRSKIVGSEARIPIIVVEQTGSMGCTWATTLNDRLNLIYDGNDVGPASYLHEAFHVFGMGHSSLGVQEYGDPFTVMGYGSDIDQDVLTAAAEILIGSVADDQIAELDAGTVQTLRLLSLVNPDKGVHALRIPLGGERIALGEGDDARTGRRMERYADSVVIELSSGEWQRGSKEPDAKRWVSLKAYAVDEQKKTTYLLSFVNGQHTINNNDVNGLFGLQIGGHVLVLRPQTIFVSEQNHADGEAVLQVGVDLSADQVPLLVG